MTRKKRIITGAISILVIIVLAIVFFRTYALGFLFVAFPLMIILVAVTLIAVLKFLITELRK